MVRTIDDSRAVRLLRRLIQEARDKGGVAHISGEDREILRAIAEEIEKGEKGE